MRPTTCARCWPGWPARCRSCGPTPLPKAVAVGGQEYKTTIPLRSPADDGAARATFLRWIWYASRRADLHLDEAEDDFAGPERVADAMRVVAADAATQRRPSSAEHCSPHVRLTRYGADETLQVPGEVPDRMTFIVERPGPARSPRGEDGSVVAVRTLEAGDFLGQTTLTREPVLAGAYALDEVTVLQIERDQRRGPRHAQAGCCCTRSAVRSRNAGRRRGACWPRWTPPGNCETPGTGFG